MPHRLYSCERCPPLCPILRERYSRFRDRRYLRDVTKSIERTAKHLHTGHQTAGITCFSLVRHRVLEHRPLSKVYTLSFTHDDIVLVKVSSIYYCTVLGCSQLAEENEAQNGPIQGKKPKQFCLLDISAVLGTRVAHVCSPTQKSRVKSVQESWKTTENKAQIGLIIHSDPYL